MSTVMIRLVEGNIYGRISVKKPLLRKQNIFKRLQCAKVDKDWSN